MKFNFLVGCLSLFVFLFLPFVAYAHPGNVSYDGCHFCRTNCSSWGFTYGTRHNRANPYNTCSCDPSVGPRDPLYCNDSTSNDNSINNTSSIDEPTPTDTPEETPTPSPEVLATTQQDYSWLWWVLGIGIVALSIYGSYKSGEDNSDRF